MRRQKIFATTLQRSRNAIVHEATQQAPASASNGSVAEPTEATPAAPSPKHVCPDCGASVSGPGKRCYKCSGLNRRASRGVDRKPTATTGWQKQAAAGDTRRSVPVGSQSAASSEEAKEEPARGLAAVLENPPVKQDVLPPTKFACTCLASFQPTKPGFIKDIPNEGHHDDCLLYRKGGHRWPLPSATGDAKPPFTVRCGWCLEEREVDSHGVPWAVSDQNAANGGKVPV